MHAASNCALANRQILTHLTRETFSEIYPHAVLETLFDVSHNTCKKETHEFNGKSRTLYDTAKELRAHLHQGTPNCLNVTSQLDNPLSLVEAWEPAPISSPG